MSDDEAFKKLPPAEQKLRRKLGEALLRFVKNLTALHAGRAEEDMELLALGIRPEEERPEEVAERRRLAQNFRIEVERVAGKGVESAFVWHTLATWTELGKERIGFFSRALECVESGREAHLMEQSPKTDWSNVHTCAECLYEIGRVHAHEGNAAVARDFLIRALPLAQEAERLRAPADVTHEDHLEGKIAELLVQLPDGPEAERTE